MITPRNSADGSIVLRMMRRCAFAAALSIPVGTVMSRLNRGRRKLQETLADYGDAESQDSDRNSARPAESPEAP